MLPASTASIWLNASARLLPPAASMSARTGTSNGDKGAGGNGNGAGLCDVATAGCNGFACVCSVAVCKHQRFCICCVLQNPGIELLFGN